MTSSTASSTASSAASSTAPAAAGPAVHCLAVLVLLVACGAPDVPPDAGASGPDAATPAACAEHADCDDGLFCNGAERCAPEDPSADPAGCASGSVDPCLAGQRCSEDEGLCLTDCEQTPDADGDSHPARECGGDDCDDSDRNRFPGNPEVCDTEHHDEDCDPRTFGYRDLDADGFPDAQCCNVDADGGSVCGSDCDDALGAVHPTEAESCDGLDNDCDGLVDEGVSRAFYPDGDGDGFGDASAEPVTSCTKPDGMVEDRTDCDDSEAHAKPGGTEVCDGLDNDCDGLFDGPGEDRDGDGYATDECGGDDCNDYNEAFHPGAPEICDHRDNDCDGGHDDQDGDGFLAISETCSGGAYASDPRTDCDDSDGSVHSDADDVCNGGDDDCDGTVDESAADFCDLFGATPVCADGSCGFGSCLPGGRFVDCDADTANGCEDTAYSATHCGGCDASSCSFSCDGAGGCDAVVDVSATNDHTCAVTAAGHAFCWGSNRYGQLGHGSTLERRVPYRVPLGGIVQVETGTYHTCARTGAGAVHCWGLNRDGQLGDGTDINRSTPVEVPGLDGVVDLAVGPRTSCALRADGDLCCWGVDTSDLLGDGTPNADSFEPVCRATGFVEVELGQSHGCGLDAEGRITCWGSNSFGQCSRAPAGAHRGLSAGALFACAIRISDGALQCWGDNRDGQLGGSDYGSSRGPFVVAVEDVASVGAGAEAACAVDGAGAVYCWGEGLAVPVEGYTPTRIPELSGASAVEVTDYLPADSVACVIHGGGALSCWGANDEGQVGDGTAITRGSPVQVSVP